jgi:hypothetical protein
MKEALNPQGELDNENRSRPTTLKAMKWVKMFS